MVAFDDAGHSRLIRFYGSEIQNGQLAILTWSSRGFGDYSEGLIFF